MTPKPTTDEAESLPLVTDDMVSGAVRAYIQAGKRYGHVGMAEAMRFAIEAALASKAPQADGCMLVPREFVAGFHALAHNYSLKADAPFCYHGVERDAFSAAYAECGNALAKLRAMLAAAHPPKEQT
jgi:hypothetical protein